MTTPGTDRGAHLRVDGLTIGLPKTPAIVRDLSFQLHAGDRVALLGRSGSGKSLIASAVAGVLPPVMRADGTVTLGGSRSAAGAARRSGVALIQQDSSDALNPLVRVGTQLAMPFIRRGEAQRARRESVDLLESIGIGDADRVLGSFPAELSGGQRQRVCIALALACRARLVVADEPTTALDVVTQAAVVRALAAHRSGTAGLLFITHDLAVAAALCDRAIVVDRGRIVQECTMEELFDAPAHPVSQSLVHEARERSLAEAA